MGTLIGIYVADVKTGLSHAVEQTRAVPGHGLDGDRYARGAGTFSKPNEPSNEVTLIEAEALEALERDYSVRLTPEESRRNLLTRGAALNHLVGRDFWIGEVSLHGLRLCEPCGHLEKLTAEGVEKGLRHRGGLRARVLKEGVLKRGDEIRVEA